MHLTEASKFPACWVNNTILSLVFHPSSSSVSPRSAFVDGGGCFLFVYVLVLRKVLLYMCSVGVCLQLCSPDL